MLSFLKDNWWRLLALAGLLSAGVWLVGIPWHIYEKGTPAQAQVLDVWSTSTTVNDEPLIGLLLEVRPADGQAFQIERRCRRSLESDWLFRKGARVDVRMDPRFPGRVVMVSADCDRVFASIWLTALSTVGMILLSFIFVPVLTRRFVYNKDLQTRGVPASATVLRVWDTNVRINDEQRVGVLLHVVPEVGEPFDVESKLVVPYSILGGLHPGKETQILYDPHKPSRLVFLPLKSAEEQPDLADRLKKLENLHSQNLILDEEYEQLRQAILKEI
jgi:hypothetical protein